MPTRDPLDKTPKPTAKEVNEFHEKSDKDGGPKAQHHTLGPSPNQASPGNHTHDGGTSPSLLEGSVLSGSRGGNAALPSIIAALVQLGATDNTVP